VAAQQSEGLVDRRTADRWAAAIFLLLLILGCLVLYSVVNEPPPKTTTVIKTTKQQATGAKSPSPQTETIETTVSDVSVSVWERLLGRRIAILLVAAAALLAAFVGGGVVQRVLLGQYAFTLGPLTVPAITTADVAKAAQAATQGLAAQSPPSAIERAGRGVGGADASTNLAWETADDPNLALAGWRLDLEQRLRRLARAQSIDAQGDADELLQRLLGRGVIKPSAADGLQQLLDIASRAIHGDRVDSSVVHVLRSSGRQILTYLDGLSDSR
jgi:hypothetical protein